MAKTWKELHELKNLEGVKDELTDRQHAFIALANTLDIYQYFVQEAGFDLGKAQELSDELDCFTKVAEYLDNKYPDVELENIGGAINAIGHGKMEAMMAGMFGGEPEASAESTVPENYN